MPDRITGPKIEPTQNMSPARTSDGSFDNLLEQAKTDLEKESNSSDIWAQLSSLFGFMALSFDFKFETQDLNPPKDPAEDKNDSADEAKPIKKQEQKKQQTVAHSDDSRLVITDTKVLKDALIKYTPAPIVPAFSMVQASSNVSKPISKSDMQLLIDQMVEQAKLVKSKEKVQLSMLLREQDLGEMSLSLSSRNGAISILISASHDLKKSLDASVADIEKSMDIANIKIEEIRITEVENDGTNARG